MNNEQLINEQWTIYQQTMNPSTNHSTNKRYWPTEMWSYKCHPILSWDENCVHSHYPLIDAKLSNIRVLHFTGEFHSIYQKQIATVINTQNQIMWPKHVTLQGLLWCHWLENWCWNSLTMIGVFGSWKTQEVCLFDIRITSCYNLLIDLVLNFRNSYICKIMFW